jgi:serine/threonine protein kinase
MSKENHRNALPAGSKLHWYSIDRVLGQGGFGITYLARDHNLEQAVALKEYLPSEIVVRAEDGSLQPRSPADAEHYKWGLDRFLSEARTLARFVHPNICQVVSVFEANHTAYMVMRYEQGESLRAILKQGKPPSEEQLLAIALPILDGLGKIHAAGFIHRDIQPSNIYIREDGSPVLLDFGAARKTLDGPRTLTILVAPGYAPIEQYYSSSAEQGPWTDIYGMGATLYRAVAGVAPIDAIERSRGMLGSTKDMLVPAKVVGQGRYTDSFLTAIDHALMFSERHRPQTAAAFAAELRGELAPAPQKQPASTAKVRVPPQPPKSAILSVESERVTHVPPELRVRTGLSPRWIAAGIVVVAVAIGLGAWIALSGTPEPAPATTAETPSPVALPESQITFNPDSVFADTPPLVEPNRDVPGSPGDATATVGIAAATPAGAAPEPSPPPAEPDPAAEQDAARAELEAKLEEQRAAMEAERRRSLELEAKLREAELKRVQELKAARKREETIIAARLAPSISSASSRPETPAVPEPAPLQAGLNALSAGNYRTALQILGPLASDGEPLAQYHVATLYRSGRGVLANNATALDWMRKAAVQGEPEAQLSLGRMYLEGVDGIRDYFLAYTWFLVADRNGAHAIPAERNEAESGLQSEQKLQASMLAAHLAQSARRIP